MRGRVLIAIALVVATTSETRAETAEELSNQAAQEVDAKDFAAAAELFRKASLLEPSEAKHLCNTGMAFYAAGEYPRAHHYLERCIGLDESRRKGNKDIVGFLRKQSSAERKLVLYSISARTEGQVLESATITCDYFAEDGPLVGNGTLLLPPGKYNIRIEAPGYEPEAFETDLTSVRTSGRTIVMRKRAVVEPVEPERTPAQELMEPASDAEKLGSNPTIEARPEPSRWSRKGPWIAFGGAAVATVGGVLSLRKAVSERNEAFACVDNNADNCAALTDNAFDEAKARVRKWEYIEYALYGAAATSAAVGIYLLVRDPEPRESRLSLSPTPGIDGAMVWLEVVR